MWLDVLDRLLWVSRLLNFRSTGQSLHFKNVAAMAWRVCSPLSPDGGQQGQARMALFPCSFCHEPQNAGTQHKCGVIYCEKQGDAHGNT